MGAPEWLTVLAHGGREAVSAVFCVRALGRRCVGGAPPSSCSSAAVSASPRWRGWVARYVLAVPWRHCSEVSNHLLDWGVAEGVWSRCCLSVRVRKVRCRSGRKPSPTFLPVVMVAALLERRSSRWGHHYGASYSEAWSLGVKTRFSFLDERRRRLRRRVLLGGAASRDSSQPVAVWEVVWLARAQRHRWCTLILVLVARCRGPMGAGGLGLVRKVQW